MIYLFLYIANMLDALLLISAIGILLISMAMLFNFISISAESEYTKEKDYSFIKWSGKVLLILTLICIFVPTKTTAYQMLGIKVGKDVATKINVGKKLDKVSTLIDLEIDKAIKDMEKK